MWRTSNFQLPTPNFDISDLTFDFTSASYFVYITGMWWSDEKHFHSKSEIKDYSTWLIAASRMVPVPLGQKNSEQSYWLGEPIILIGKQIEQYGSGACIS